MADIPITPGTGGSSVATELVAGRNFQLVELYGQGGASALGVNPDHSINVSVIGTIQTTGSVIALVTGTPSISGTVNIGTMPGSVVTFQGTTPWVVGSVSGALNVSGSVLLGSSNASVIAVLQSSSIIAINAGSVITVPSGSVIAIIQAESVVGTYAEDAAHTSGDKGLFSLNVRNDTLASVTSTDGDYGALSVGPAGEAIVANSPITKWVQGVGDFRGNAGASIVVLAAGGSSVFTYATGVQIANMGSASVLVTLASGGSILGYSIAPAGGGSNIVYPNGLKTPANFGFAASLSGVASVLVSAQGFISKT